MRNLKCRTSCAFLCAVCVLGVQLEWCVAQETLSVMTFNIRYGSADDGPNAWEHRKEVVANTIREYGPDIVGTQECLQFQAQYLDDVLPAYEHFGTGRNANGSGERMEVFYKTEELAPIETGNFWLSKTPEIPGSRDWDSANIRMVTWAKFHHIKSRRFFYYVNTHFDHRSEEARKQSARILARHVRKLPKKSAVIVGGDFNAAAEQSEPWEILTGGALMDTWLSTYVYRIDLSIWLFVTSALIALSVALLTVGHVGFRAARRNPVDALRYE